MLKSNYEKVPRKSSQGFFWWIREAEEFAFEWHHHAEIELTFILSGEGQRMIGSTIEPYKENDLVIIGSNIPHTYVSNKEFPYHKALVIQFEKELIQKIIEAFPELSLIKAMLDDTDYGIHFNVNHELKEIIKVLKSFEQLNTLYIPEKFIYLLTHLSDCSYRKLMLANTFSAKTDKNQKRIDEVYEYLHKWFNQPFDLSKVAETANMSETSLCRFFKKVTSKTITQYIKELRISYASRLLIDTDLNVSQIALDSGYNDLSNFTKHFKELKGNSPLKHRKLFHKKNDIN